MRKNVTLGDLSNIAERQKLILMIQELYLLANKPEITTTDPNGNIISDKGTLMYHDNSGTLVLKHNTDGETAWSAV